MELGSRDTFTRQGTLGIEEEFYVVDSEGRPTAGTDELVYESDPPLLLEDRLDHELFKCVIETQTPTIESLSDAESTLQDVRSALIAHANDHGFEIAAAGLHPAAKWRELEHAEKPRYRSQLDRIQYPQHRNTTAGLHIHVGVDNADKAVWISNELRWYLPIMLALSSNSPYWNGYDTGLASARSKIFEGLPNTGIPTKFDDFDEFEQFEKLMVESNAINDRGELWFEVRPHSAHGTVEIRTPDAHADTTVVMGFVEYASALISALSDDYEDGVKSTDIRREILDENKWRAIRHGHDASFISPDYTDTLSLEEIVEQECDRLGINGIQQIFEDESGSSRQRRLLESDGLDAVCTDLILKP